MRAPQPQGRATANRRRAPARRVAEDARVSGVLVAPARVGERVVGGLELLRSTGPLGPADEALADLAAAHLALTVRTLVLGSPNANGEGRVRIMEAAGEAL